MITTECVTYDTWCERLPSHNVNCVKELLILLIRTHGQ